MWIQIISIEYILCEEYLQPIKSMFGVANMLKSIYCQRCVNEQLWISKHTGLFISYVL